MANLMINGQTRSDIVLVDYSIEPSKNTYTTQWRRNAANPIITNQQAEEKEIKLKCLVVGNTKDDALKNVSNLCKDLSQCSLRFSDTSFTYDVYMPNSPTITWYGDTDTGYDVCRYIVEATVSSGRGYTDSIRVQKTLTFTQGQKDASTTFNIDGNVSTPLVIDFQIVSGATTDHLVYFGLNASPNFDILNDYVKDKFAFLDILNGELVEVNSENFKILSNGVTSLSSFRGDFPFAKAPQQLTLNVEFAALMSGESSIVTNVWLQYRPRWF